MSTTQATSGRSLPEDLIMEILPRLPVKTLLRFKSVSKSLHNLIINPDFVKLHLIRSRIQNPTVALLRSGHNFFASIDLDQPQRPVVQVDTHPDVIKLLYPPKIIGICNGVVCFRKLGEFVLYNPATRAYKQVPKPNVSPDRYRFHDEFVYDSISDDFKIFRFMESYDEKTRMNSESYMYNLKDNSWSEIADPPPNFHPQRSCNHIASNYLYWIAFNRDSKNAKVLLVRFDVSSNTYEEMSLPPSVAMHSLCWCPRLGVLNGRLHITRNGKKPEIWMLKEDNCWTLVFRCSEWEYPVKRCLFYSKDGRKIFLGLRHKVRKFICCDLDSQTTSVVEILGLPEGPTFKALPWAESLVPLI
ncbi:F-box protein CPR1-like [Silene latifolia]|uniref:F-box protein CPR1-like n=1 Tax=Silene latifolia TaxID=37657 RepID=UPI003D77A339